MVLLSKDAWEIAGGAAAVAALCGVAVWLLLRNRTTEEEREKLRRALLVQSGRLVDGMLLDICEMKGEQDEPLTLLLFSYRIGGVDYECSQDITRMAELLDKAEIRVGFPCSVRYQPGNPQNSIVVAEGWSGLRAGLPQFPHFEGPEPIDTSHLKKAGTKGLGD